MIIKQGSEIRVRISIVARAIADKMRYIFKTFGKDTQVEVLRVVDRSQKISTRSEKSMARRRK